MLQNMIFEKSGYKFYFNYSPIEWKKISIDTKLCVYIQALDRVIYYFPVFNGTVDWDRFETSKYFSNEIKKYVTNKVKLLPFL